MSCPSFLQTLVSLAAVRGALSISVSSAVKTLSRVTVAVTVTVAAPVTAVHAAVAAAVYEGPIVRAPAPDAVYGG